MTLCPRTSSPLAFPLSQPSFPSTRQVGPPISVITGPRGGQRTPPCGRGTFLQDLLPPGSAQPGIHPSEGATKAWGPWDVPPSLSSRETEGLEECSESEHALLRRLLCAGAAFSGSQAQQHWGLRVYPLSCLTPPPPPPLRAGGRATRLPFRQLSFSPMSVPLQPEERRSLLVSATRGQAPPSA